MFNLLGQVYLPPYQYGVGHHHHKLDEDRDVHLSFNSFGSCSLFLAGLTKLKSQLIVTITMVDLKGHGYFYYSDQIFVQIQK